ncbi:regulator of chromosome condensation 1/beta-lactamase-inhibitor protein II [Baffinella frigidus]|nr:regulator of chromosome condensation 1/beta-lactamase-inhibitor protein II [Cryptophyta sp. CCMP2293]
MRWGQAPPPAQAYLPAVDLDKNALMIMGGGTYTCALLEGGLIKCWGYNGWGQLGYGDTRQRGDTGWNEMGASIPSFACVYLPTVDLNATAVAIECGLYFTCALLEGGFVKCWGENNHGQLGYGDTRQRGDGAGEMGASTRPPPRINLPFVSLNGTAVAVVSGDYHAYLPAVDLDMKAVMVTGGGKYSCALLEGGLIKCWGYNGWGQLGQGDTRQRGDERDEMGARTLPRTEILPYVDLNGLAIAISIGYVRSCAIMEGGFVKCWGDNENGQLGYSDTRQRGDRARQMGASTRPAAYLPAVDLGGVPAVALALGERHSCALLEGGFVKCWGYNAHGQLGQGDTRQRGDAANEMGASTPPHAYLPAVDLGGNAVAVVAGQLSGCALVEGGLVKCWGYNAWGQLGYGDTRQRGDVTIENDWGEMGAITPSRARDPTSPGSADASLARREPSKVSVAKGSAVRARSGGVGAMQGPSPFTTLGAFKCWGQNTYGQLGYGDMRQRGDEAYLPAVDLDGKAEEISRSDQHGCSLMANLPAVELDGKAIAITAGYNWACAILASEGGFVKCWGYNAQGQLGYGDSRQRGDAVGLNGKAVAITAGYQQTCAILAEGGTLKCWGGNPWGVQGSGGGTTAGNGVVQCWGYNGWGQEGGFVKCWGYNNEGQLGYGDSRQRVALQVYLPAVDLDGSKAVAIECGQYFSCALLEGGFVKCWGQNNYGQLGYGDTRQRGDGGSEMGASTPATSLATGDYHADMTVKCWGRNDQGQLGYSDTRQRGDGGGEMGASTPSRVNLVAAYLPAVDLDGNATMAVLPYVDLNGLAVAIYAGFRRSCAILKVHLRAVDLEGVPAVALALGEYHTCVLLLSSSKEGGFVKCWGSNDYGELGYGDRANLPAVDIGGKTFAIALGDRHSCGLVEGGFVKCWGWNNYGQLGYGDTRQRGDGEGGIVKCWGHNGQGQLGYGDTRQRGDGAGEMGARIPSHAGDFDSH